MFVRLSWPRRSVITIILLILQGIAHMCLVALVLVLGMEAVRNAIAAHKATAATLSTAFAVIGGSVFFIIGLFALIFAWGLWKQKGWAFWGPAILEGFSLLISLALLCGGNVWLSLSEGVLAVVILVCLYTAPVVSRR